ncbi:MAG: PEP-CTERM sorting domain-containing protein [Verrucomicrobiales bacterium]|nr:PEP-CTERM sorting domain-containing protein [Verrucomicrobiales bacterium]
MLMGFGALMVTVLPAVRAAQVTWTGASGADGNLNNTDNTGGATIGAADDVIFNAPIANGWGEAATPVTIPAAGVVLQYITFGGAAGDYTIATTTGGTLALTSNGYIRIDNTYAGSGTMTVAAPLFLQGSGDTNHYFVNNSANGTLLITGNINNTTTGRPFFRMIGSNTNANTISGNITNAIIIKEGNGTWNLDGFINTAGASQAAWLGGGVLNVSGTWNVNGKGFQTRTNSTASGTLVVKDDGRIYGFGNNVNTLSGRIILKDNAIMESTGGNMAFGFDGNTGADSINAPLYLDIQDNALLKSSGGFRFIVDNAVGGNAVNTVVIVNQTGGMVQAAAGIAVGERSRGSASSGTGVYNFNGGVLMVGNGNIYGDLTGGGVNVLDNGKFIFNGGTLRASANMSLKHDNTGDSKVTGSMTNGRFIISGSGAKIDTNGFTVNVSGTLEHDAALGVRDGGLYKVGSGTLTLNNLNTFTGDINVHEGILDVAAAGGLTFSFADGAVTNKLYGDGLALLNGTFVIDYSLVSDAIGTWQIVDLPAGYYNYGATFKVEDYLGNTWVNNGDLWEYDGYSFSELTGVVSLIPEPSVVALLVTGAALLVALRRRK